MSAQAWMIVIWQNVTGVVVSLFIQEVAMSHPVEPRKICVTFEEYLQMLGHLVRTIRASGFMPQQVVCVARGGLLPGEIASRAFGVPLAVLSVASYPEQGTQQEKMFFSRDLTSAKPLRRQSILVLDDLTETGLTLAKTVEWLNWWYSIPRQEIKTATVWHKTWSEFVPDFYAQAVAPDSDGSRPWIVQPQERFCQSLIEP